MSAKLHGQCLCSQWLNQSFDSFGSFNSPNSFDSFGSFSSPNSFDPRTMKNQYVFHYLTWRYSFVLSVYGNSMEVQFADYNWDYPKGYWRVDGKKETRIIRVASNGDKGFLFLTEDSLL